MHYAIKKSASRPGRFITKENVPVTHCTGGWLGFRIGLDDVKRRKVLALGYPTRSQSLYLLSYSVSDGMVY
jgi:hypothetical protein